MAHSTGMRRWRFEHLFDGTQWMQDVVVDVDEDGLVARVCADGRSDREDRAHRRPTGPPPERDATRVPGTVLPAMRNLHGHAFQRAFAGRVEHRGPRTRASNPDSFWTWREAMYAAAARLTPDALRAGATSLYRELRAAGFSEIAEFHYVHGSSPKEMAEVLVDAADAADVRLCLLPVLYQRADFREPSPRSEQRRFVLETDAYLRLFDDLVSRLRPTAHRLGLALHSLRAVGDAGIDEVLAHRARVAPEMPVHIHVAEQPAEVEACIAVHGQRPVERLLERFDVDDRWCLIHATHAQPVELREVARRGSVVGLCPSTEANLGDGIFDLSTLLAAGGTFGIGTDAHVCLSPLEELRWLEYVQRLRTGRRNVVDAPTPHVGTNLWMRAAEGGSRACGGRSGRIEVGEPADWVVVDDRAWSDLPVDERIDALVFAPNPPRLTTWVGGRPGRDLPAAG